MAPFGWRRPGRGRSDGLGPPLLLTPCQQQPWIPGDDRGRYDARTRRLACSGGLRWTCVNPGRSPEKRKADCSTPPLTTVVTCADVRLVIVEVQLVGFVVSFLGHLLRADSRTSTHSRRSRAHLSSTVGLGSALSWVTGGGDHRLRRKQVRATCPPVSSSRSSRAYP